MDHKKFRKWLHEVIFEAETPTGKFFDITLLVLILISVVAVMLETVAVYDEKYHRLFLIIEWTVTVLFTIEYLLRIYSIDKPWKYVKSFFGIVDLLAILPTYLSFIIAGSHYLLTIRVLRVLRVFRVFKLARFLGESHVLITAMRASRHKITVFLVGVLTIVVIIGSAMYFIESPLNEDYSSIPKSVYWAIVTLTTVGYGDITPITTVGQFLSAMLMILGYGVLAVPTGIVTTEIAMASRKKEFTTEACPACSREGHDPDAKHCKYCGALL